MNDSQLHRELGLTDEEAQRIEEILGRAPNHLELAMYAVMWSEHCSYKSSRIHLKRLPSQGPRVVVGPGENAGVVDAGDGLGVAIRIESHNHPSAIEPYQGAATGVGGILRDVFTMGARPVALLDPLSFGPLEDPRSRWVASGVVSGISGYGNSVGVPTVGGEVIFDEAYAGNPLVNVMCVGVLPLERLVLARASGVGNLAVLLGSRTGRDGIGGVSVLASAGFGEDLVAESAKRPNVQVGDPYEEKRLIEACLALLDERLVEGIQDLGGAGLTCATSETASRGGVGMDVDVLAVPRREPGMAPWEVMTSESQERMLAIVTPVNLGRVLEVCQTWEVEATVVGRVTEGGRLRILEGFDGKVLADVPAASLHDDAPLYDRPCAAPSSSGPNRPELSPLPRCDPGQDLLSLGMDRSWVWRQYDHQLFLNTVVGPGADAALLRLSGPGVRAPRGRPLKAMALTTDSNFRWCSLDPRRGTAMVVAEAALNVACVGAVPTAVVNCLNFGNPEHPEVMWQLSEAIDGMAEACLALGLPVVGGNVSLYNESRGRDIPPTPVVGMLGLVERLELKPPVAALEPGAEILLAGALGQISLAGSAWAGLHGVEGGELARLDYDLHLRLLGVVAALAMDPKRPLAGLHDVSEGGVALSLGEMSSASGVGFVVSGELLGAPEGLFGEGPSRVVLCVRSAQLESVVRRLEQAGVPWARIGQAGGDHLVIEGVMDLELDTLRRAWTDRIPAALALPSAH